MKDIVSEYIREEIEVLDSLDQEKILEIYSCIERAYKNGGRVYLLGNGGSSANTSHWVSDLKKNIQNTDNGFDIISLTDNVPLLTAYANDVAYAKVFLEQIVYRIREVDVMIALSVSGSSMNLVEAFRYANQKKCKTISIIANYEGKLAQYSDITLTLDTKSYGIAEDVQQTINHILVQLCKSCEKVMVRGEKDFEYYC